MDSGDRPVVSQPRSLLTLPEEVLWLIASRLDFQSLLHLRKVVPGLSSFHTSSLSSAYITDAVLLRHPLSSHMTDYRGLRGVPLVEVEARCASNSLLRMLYDAVFPHLRLILPRVAVIRRNPDGSVYHLTIRDINMRIPDFSRLHHSLQSVVEFRVCLGNVRRHYCVCVDSTGGNCGFGPLPRLRVLSVEGLSREIPELCINPWTVPSLERLSLRNRYDDPLLSSYRPPMWDLQDRYPHPSPLGLSSVHPPFF